MKRFLLMILTVCGSQLAADDAGFQPNAGPSGVQITTPAASQDTKALVEAMSDYQLQNNIINSLEVSRNWYNDRVRYEFHLGGGLLLPPTAETAQSGVPAYRLNGAADLRPAYFVGLKMNLGNLKMVAPERTLASLERLKHLIALRHYTFSDSASAEVADMETHISQYTKEFWWKRFSLEMSMPFLYRTDRGVQSYSQTYFNGSSYVTNDYQQTYYEVVPGFGFNQTVFSLGYDLGDVATVSLGYSMSNAFALGVSIDISTPIYYFGDNFFNMLRAWAGTPSTAPYQNNYYNRY